MGAGLKRMLGAGCCGALMLLAGAAGSARPPGEHGASLLAGLGRALADWATVLAPPAADPDKADWAGWAADEDGVFTLAVFGDSLADGYWGGVYRKLAREDRFAVLRRAENATGLSRSDYFDWATALEDHLTADPIDAALVSMGANDHQSIYLGNHQYLHYGSAGWDAAYQVRVVQMMTRLKQAGVVTFWLGLPVVRDDERADAARRLNRLYAAAAQEAGVVFIPLWELTADDGGQFSSYLPDDDGRARLMRANDGVHFTALGYGMVADHVLSVMDRELSLFDEAAAP